MIFREGEEERGWCDSITSIGCTLQASHQDWAHSVLTRNGASNPSVNRKIPITARAKIPTFLFFVLRVSKRIFLITLFLKFIPINVPTRFKFTQLFACFTSTFQIPAKFQINSIHHYFHSLTIKEPCLNANLLCIHFSHIASVPQSLTFQ